MNWQMNRRTDKQEILFHRSFTFNNQVGVVGDPRPTIWADDTAVAAGAALGRVANADSGGEAAVVHHSGHHQCRVSTVPLLQGFRKKVSKKVWKFPLQRSTLKPNVVLLTRVVAWSPTLPDSISSFCCRIICQFRKICRLAQAFHQDGCSIANVATVRSSILSSLRCKPYV